MKATDLFLNLIADFINFIANRGKKADVKSTQGGWMPADVVSVEHDIMLC